MSQKKIIWFAIVVASFIYAVIVYHLSTIWPKPIVPFELAVRNAIVLGLYGVAAFTFVGALAAGALIRAKRPAFIMSLALFEAVVIYGLLAAFLRQDWRLFIAPWVAGLVGFAMKFPSEAPEPEDIAAQGRFD